MATKKEVKKQVKVTTKKSSKKPLTLSERVRRVYKKYGEKCKSNDFLISKMKEDFERLGSDKTRFNGSVKRILNRMLKNGDLN